MGCGSCPWLPTCVPTIRARLRDVPLIPHINPEGGNYCPYFTDRSSTYPPIHLSIYLPTYSLDIHYQLTHASIYHPSSILLLSINPSTHSPIYLSIHLPIHLLDIHYQPTHLAIYPSIPLSICPSVCSSILPPIYPPTPLSIIYPIFLTLSIYPSACSAIHAPVYSAIHLPTHPLNPLSPFILFQLGLKAAGRGMRENSC